MTEALKKWNIPVEGGFTEIDNGDSVQLTNADGSRVIYVSVMAIADKDGGPVDLSKIVASPPEFVFENNSYHFRGTKLHGSEMLVIVITLTDKGDESWARELFDKIDYNEIRCRFGQKTDPLGKA